MGRLQDFEREIKIATAGFEPAEIAKRVAAIARAERDKVLAEQAARDGIEPKHRVFVDGQEGASEDAVSPGGRIVYLFEYWTEIAIYGLAFLRGRSPVESGAYRDAWFALIGGEGGEKVEPEAIPFGTEELFLVNDKPYARKIHVGAGRFSAPPGIAEDGRQAINARYGNIVKAEVRFITLAGGYVLKGRAPRRAAAPSRRSSATRAGRTTLASRKDTAAGQAMTYPAVHIAPR